MIATAKKALKSQMNMIFAYRRGLSTLRILIQDGKYAAGYGSADAPSTALSTAATGRTPCGGKEEPV